MIYLEQFLSRLWLVIESPEEEVGEVKDLSDGGDVNRPDLTTVSSAAEDT